MKYGTNIYVRGIDPTQLESIAKDLKAGNTISTPLTAFRGKSLEIQCRIQETPEKCTLCYTCFCETHWLEVCQNYWITNDTRRSFLKILNNKSIPGLKGQIDIFGKVIHKRGISSKTSKLSGKGYEIGNFGIVTEWD